MRDDLGEVGERVGGKGGRVAVFLADLLENLSAMHGHGAGGAAGGCPGAPARRALPRP